MNFHRFFYTSNVYSQVIRTVQLLALLVTYYSCNAQADTAEPKRVYDKNYAAVPSNAGTAAPNPTLATTVNSSIPSQKITSIPPAASSHRPPPKQRRRRIIASVFVSSTDAKHFTEVIQNVMKLHDQRLAFITSVTHIGDYRSVTPDLEAGLTQRGIHLHADLALPDDLKAELSPTWRVMTAQGFHIAEGFSSIERMINEWGEYDPARADPKAPDLKMEGF